MANFSEHHPSVLSVYVVGNLNDLIPRPPRLANSMSMPGQLVRDGPMTPGEATATIGMV